MAVSKITFDSDYMREIARNTENAQRLIDEARATLRRANRHNGWRCEERQQINNSLGELSTWLDRVSNGVRETSLVLVKGAELFADLESRSQQEESNVTRQVRKNWLFGAIDWVAGVATNAITHAINTFLPVTMIPTYSGPPVITLPGVINFFSRLF